MKLRAILFSVALLLALPLFAAVREVGSGQTYTTIQACHNAATAGDTCNIHAGSYTETVTVSKSLIFQNNSGESPVLTGRFELNATANVTITCNNGGGAMEITGFGSASTALYGVHQSGGTGMTVTGCKIHDGYGTGIYSRNSTKITITNNEIYVMSNASSGADADGIGIVSGHSTDGTYANGVLISGNNSHDNHTDGMKINGQYFIVQNNTVTNNLYSDWAAIHPDGIQLNAGSADGYTSVQHAKIINNVFSNQTQEIFLEGSVSGEASDCEDILVANNVVYRAGTVHGVDTSALVGTAINVKFVNGAYIYNNTCGTVYGDCIRVADSKNGTVFIKNNICEQSAGSGNCYNIQTVADMASGSLDYGQCLITSGNCVSWGGTGYATLTAFNTAVPTQMANRVSASATLNAFPTPTLIAGSPAIGAAVNLSSSCSDCTTDKNGVSRTVPWDMGAYETITGGAPATSYNPTSLTFAEMPVGHGTVTQTITLTNVGSTNLTVSSVAASGTNAADFHVTTTCVSASPIAASGTCTITIYFNPQAAGSRSGSVTITSDAASSPDVLTLSGTAVTKSSIALIGVPQ